MWDWDPNAVDRDEDAERYRLLSRGIIDDLSENEAGTLDPIVLLSVGPFPDLTPGRSLRCVVAFLGGADAAALEGTGGIARTWFRDGYGPAPVLRADVVRNPTGRHSAEVRIHVRDPGPVTVDLFDVAGRRVYRERAVIPSGVTTRRWDGRNEGGELVAPGVYFWSIRTPRRAAVVRQVLLDRD